MNAKALQISYAVEGPLQAAVAEGLPSLKISNNNDNNGTLRVLIMTRGNKIIIFSIKYISREYSDSHEVINKL